MFLCFLCCLFLSEILLPENETVLKLFNSRFVLQLPLNGAMAFFFFGMDFLSILALIWQKESVASISKGSIVEEASVKGDTIVKGNIFCVFDC